MYERADHDKLMSFFPVVTFSNVLRSHQTIFTLRYLFFVINSISVLTEIILGPLLERCDFLFMTNRETEMQIRIKRLFLSQLVVIDT